MASTIQVDKIEGRSASTITVPAGQTLDISNGTLTISTLEPTGDTSAGDNAAIGYTAAEGVIITGQGSTNDITVKNDADVEVIAIPTGTTDVQISTTTAGTGTGAKNKITLQGIAGNANPNGMIQFVSVDNGESGQRWGMYTNAVTGADFVLGYAASGTFSSVFEAQTDLSVDFKGAVNVTGDLNATGTVEPAGDTSAGDNAAIGYTAGEGLILTGQGSTSDITVKNDADGTVFTVPTGTDDILFPDAAKAMWGASSDLQIYHDGSHSYISDGGTGSLIIKATDLYLQDADGDRFLYGAQGGGVELYYNASARLTTTSAGATVTGDLTISGDDLTMATNTSGAILVADGTNYNPAVVSGDVTIGTDGAVTIADNAVTLAKMAGGTDGNIISFDASGNPVAVATGTAGQVLTSSGANAVCSFEDAGGPTQSTVIATTSGTSHTFTGIPAGVTRIHMSWSGVSGNGGNHFYVRLGDSGGIETTGYVHNNTVNSSYETDTVGFRFTGSTAAGTFEGNMTFILLDSSTNTWTGSGAIGNVGYGWVHSIGGAKSLSSVLTQIQFMNLTDTFDAGKMAIMYD
jgi:hypothetical protein